mmetsp:Transcript_4367/g.6355  ORF Transcript_4367/g.6355 Transcript_4367/m.6355 type:complete len:388 (-) Transcript_4367:136-1299(-)|eukprot:CAMPEP_0116015622 /NCGR_PEP_ID=MMETSP0321-20121206/6958_1 /TAXON_ID=163516 /ORGANISM="Leptocylindrus danicus var. danicus, Strain B650" /LENGTH=387 /DNA_ID=CAMNT_0003485451 /DNA_START=29 /DNA_END=1192 /DNA_ORIENTATION=+
MRLFNPLALVLHVLLLVLLPIGTAWAFTAGSSSSVRTAAGACTQSSWSKPGLLAAVHPPIISRKNYSRNRINYCSFGRCENITRLKATTSSVSNDDASMLETASVPDLNADEKMAKKIVGRKMRVQNGYKIIAIGYALNVLFSVSWVIAFHVAASMTLPAGIAYILNGAAKNDRLSSDTYKRLNLALGFYGFFGFFAKSAFKQRMISILWGLTSVVTMINCIKGYGYGLKGWALSDKVNPISELADGTKSYFATLVKPIKDWKAFGYLVATLLFGYMKLLALSDVITDVFSGSSGLQFAGRNIIQYIRLMLLSTLTFTLKDAADRDRLMGTTFIETNIFVALASTSMAVLSFTRIPNLLFGRIATGIAGFCALNAAVSIAQKKREAQ